MTWPESSSRGETEVKSVWMSLSSHELCSSSAALQLSPFFFFLAGFLGKEMSESWW